MANEWQIIIPVLFALVGFFAAFFLRKAVSLTMVALFGYAVYLLLYRLQIVRDWSMFNDLTNALQLAGRKILIIINGILGSASIASILAFVFGGSIGLFTRKGD